MMPIRPLFIVALALAAVSACRTSPREGPAAVGDYPHTEADVRFMSRMIGHHAQAIAMARLAPSNAASASIRTLAERIINAQQDEIALMHRWLRDRGLPVPDTSASAFAPDHHGGARDPMPGMVSEAQMRQLASARGAEFDRLFLTFMIQHHKGAITMVEELIQTPGAAQNRSVFKLASDVNVDQSTEVARMSKMLTALIFERPPQ